MSRPTYKFFGLANAFVSLEGRWVEQVQCSEISDAKVLAVASTSTTSEAIAVTDLEVAEQALLRSSHHDEGRVLCMRRLDEIPEFRRQGLLQGFESRLFTAEAVALFFVGDRCITFEEAEGDAAML